MCGIFALLNNNSNDITIDDVNAQFMKGQNRGPEFSKLTSYLKMEIGFHRLAINGLNSESNQPFEINDIILVCNGEIYNYKELYKSMNIVPKTDSDCEVILHLYLKYGIEQTLTMLDGVFSFILYDNRISDDMNNKIFIARDPLGVRPLYFLKNKKLNINKNSLDISVDVSGNHDLIGFASELKCLQEFVTNNPEKYIIEQFTPGTYSVFNLSNKVRSSWKPIELYKPYFIPTFSYNLSIDLTPKNMCDVLDDIHLLISYFLVSAVNKRCLTTERPIACLLSGGLDSSLITALVDNFYKLNGYQQQLETYSIGLQGSEDLKNARIVADYLGTKHTEIIVTEEEMCDAIPEVIYTIESYDTTSVRASIGNYLLGKYISENSDAKVIFNGDGSDELCGGYLYMNNCPDDIEFDKETRRLLKDIHLFDVLRSDKCISSHGLEPRTPFLDKTFVNSYLSISSYYRNHKNHEKIEKYLLRESFSLSNFENYKGTQILPNEILWRRKEAFSDGVSNHGRSLYKIIQDYTSEKLNSNDRSKHHIFESNIDTEKYYYKDIFDTCYPHSENIVPYFWMPKYTNATDPSARTLEIYSQEVK